MSTRNRSARRKIVLAAAAFAAVPALTHAATVTWNNAVPPGNWSSTGSWSGAAIPVAADSVIFGATGSAGAAATVTNDVNQNFTIASLNFNQRSDLGQFHNTSIDNGVTLLVNGTSSMYVGNLLGDDTGAGTQSNVTTFGGLGTLTINNASGSMVVREGSATGPLAALRATLDLSGLANFNATVNDFGVGSGTSSTTAGGNRGSGTVILGLNNTITATTVSVGIQIASSGNQSQFFLGGNGAGGGSNTINAGTMTMGGRKGNGVAAFYNGVVNGNVVIRGASGGSSRANLNLGTAQFTTVAENTATSSTGVIDLTANGAATPPRGGGTVDGMLGTVLLGRSTAGNGNGTGRLTWDSGTINANDITLGVGVAAVSPGTGVSSGTIQVRGTGQLIVNNNLTLASMVAGANTSLGTLTVGSASSTTDAATIAGDILDGGGTSTISVQNGTLSASHIGTAASPIDALTLDAANFRVAIGANAGSVVNSLVVNSATTLGVNLAGAPTAGTFVLIDYSGSITGTGSGFASLSATKFPARMNATLADNAGNTSVDLVVASYDTPKWTGTDGPNWDINSTQSWKLVTAGTPTTYQEDLVTYSTTDSVLFDDTANGVGVVPVTVAATVSPSAFTIASDRGYTLTGSGAIRGGVPITKSGTGTATIANTGGNVLGALTVNGGNLVMGDNATAGSGAMTATAISVATGATFTFNQPDANAFSGVISGSGSIAHTGSGTTTLTGTNTYSGNTTLSNGTIKGNSNATLGVLPGGTVTISGTGSFDIGGFTTADTANFGKKIFNISGAGPSSTVGVLTNSNAPVRQINAFQRVTLTGDATVGGPGRLDIRGPSGADPGALDLAGFTLTKVGTNTFGLVRDTVTDGSIHVVAGTLSIEQTTALTGNGTLTFDAGALAQFNALTGTVSRNVVLNGGGFTDVTQAVPTVIASNINLAASGNVNANSTGGFTLSGIISSTGTAGLSKSGSGTLTLTGANTYSGNSALNNGTLSVGASNNLGDASATNNIVFSGGTLQTTAAIASSGRSITLSNAGTIDTNGFDSSFGNVDGTGSFTKSSGGALTVNHVRSGNLTVNAGVLKMAADSGANGVSHVRTLNIAGGAKLDLTANKLITTSAAGTWNGTAYDGVTGQIVAGRGTGNFWDGTTGIVTSQTQAIGSNYTSIGVAKASDVRPATATATDLWAGQTITGTDTLVMYTYGGDATLDGKINIDDYVKIDSGIAANLTGWSNGDFNYDGKINIDDYTTVIDANIGNQNGTFFTAGGVDGAGGTSGVSAVPEPAGGAVIVLSSLLAGVRRRKGKAVTR